MSFVISRFLVALALLCAAMAHAAPSDASAMATVSTNAIALQSKPPIVGLVTMGNMGRLGKGLAPDNTLKEANAHPGIYSGAVIQATWLRLEPQRGRFDMGEIEQGLQALRAYNATYPEKPLVGKLRVFAGPNAPGWVKSLDGGPLSVNKKNVGRVEVPKFWTREYQRAWRELQQALADRYDADPLIREVAVSSCAALTAEPFILPIHGVAQLRTVRAAGYTDTEIRARLMEAIDDYACWKRTAIDFTFNLFANTDSGEPVDDPEFMRSVMLAFRQRYGERAVIANHGLDTPLREAAKPVCEELRVLGPPIAFQTFSPTIDFETAVALGLEYRPTEIELWDSRAAGGLAPIEAEMLRRWARAIEER